MSEVMKRKSSGTFLKSLLIVILLACALFSVLWILKSLPGTLLGEISEVQVPNIEGKVLNEAAGIIERAGLKLDVETSDYHESVPKNAIIYQEPKEGKKVKKNRIIRVKVSNGPLVVDVPDVMGLSKREAELALYNAKLKLGKIDYVVHEKADKDIVVDQDPKPLSKGKRAASVNLVVSKGLPPLVRVPQCVGRHLSNAKILLKNQNLRLGQIQWVWDEVRLLGEVLRQTPEADSQVRANSMVSFMVSGGSRNETLQMKQSMIQFVVPASEEVREVEIIVSDDVGSTQIYKAFHHGGDKIELQVSTIGEGRLEVFVGGKREENGRL